MNGFFDPFTGRARHAQFFHNSGGGKVFAVTVGDKTGERPRFHSKSHNSLSGFCCVTMTVILWV